MNTRPSVTQFDVDGKVITIDYGLTDLELYDLHVKRLCTFGCGYCYAEAIQYKKDHPND